MNPPSPSMYRLPTPVSPSLFLPSSPSSFTIDRQLSLQGGCRRRASSSRMVAVTCMANQRRVQRVAKQIWRVLSDLLLTDKVLNHAVLPEAALGADRYLSSIATISNVVVSGDLQVVKVYVSVFGDERGQQVAIAGLQAKAKYARSEIGKRVRLRLTPEIRFILDESIERGIRVNAILDKLIAERDKSGNKDAEVISESSDLSDFDDDFDDNEPNEDSKYVN